MMDALITRIVAKVGIPEPLAQQAVGMILGYVQRSGDDGAVAKMITQMPGASEMVAKFGGAETEAPAEGGGGLMGSIMGAVSSLTGGDKSGGMMAIGQQLMSEGMEMGQVKETATEIFAYAEETVDPETVQKVKNSIPASAASCKAGLAAAPFSKRWRRRFQ